MTIRELLNQGIRELKSAGFTEAESDARLLLEYLCGIDRARLLSDGDSEVSQEDVACYNDAITRRLSHEPVQYITGYQNFMGLEFRVSSGTLIPRQDTETLVEEVLRHNMDGNRILDMCTGTGCILLSILKYSNGCIGIGADIDSDAILTARENSRELGIEATFVESDLFENINNDRCYDIIVSNPPYIRSDVIAELMPEVRDYEPVKALDGAEDGLDFYRRIMNAAGEYLKKEGMIFFEIGYDQATDVCNIMQNAGFEDIEVVKDLAGLDRVVKGTYMRD